MLLYRIAQRAVFGTDMSRGTILQQVVIGQAPHCSKCMRSPRDCPWISDWWIKPSLTPYACRDEAVTAVTDLEGKRTTHLGRHTVTNRYLSFHFCQLFVYHAQAITLSHIATSLIRELCSCCARARMGCTMPRDQRGVRRPPPACALCSPCSVIFRPLRLQSEIQQNSWAAPLC